MRPAVPHGRNRCATRRDPRWCVHAPARRAQAARRSNRWLGTFNYENFKTIVEDDVIIIAQIESPRGIDNADAIAADDMVAAMGIGPFDLSAKLGLCYEPGHPTLLAAWDAIHTPAKNAGKSMWAIGDAKILHDRGLRFICIGEPMVMLENVARGLVEQLQSR